MKRSIQYIAIGLIAVIAIVSISSVLIYMETPKGGTFVFGVMYGPDEIDLHNMWDSASIDVANQVCEGLVDVDVNDPEYPIVPKLATSYSFSTDFKEVTFILRQGVNFHDGEVFDAAAVKWNFDRVNNLRNISVLAELWEWPDGSPILNRTEVVDTYTVRLVLNKPYAVLIPLLSSWSAYMMSPEATNASEFLDISQDTLVGTGPFTYLSYESEVECLMPPNRNYWGNVPAIDLLVFSVITDADARNAALLTEDITMIDSAEPAMVQTFDNAPNVALLESAPSLSIQYLHFNHELMPPEMRKAMSYAFNYTYLIDEIMQGYAVRMTSPIPDGIKYYSTENITLADYNIATARAALKDAGFPGTASLTANSDVSAGNDWEKLVTDGTPLATYNFSYNIGNPVREDILILITANFKQIGVKIEDAGMTWHEYLYRGYEVAGLHRNMLELGWIGWIPDYADASNFVGYLMTNRSVASNFAQINDPVLQLWMEEALEETDETARAELYHKIQKRSAEVVYPWIYGYVSHVPRCMAPNVRGFVDNPFKDLFHSVYLV